MSVIFKEESVSKTDHDCVSIEFSDNILKKLSSKRLEEISEALKKLNINIKNKDGTYRSYGDIINDISVIWNKKDKGIRAFIKKMFKI